MPEHLFASGTLAVVLGASFTLAGCSPRPATGPVLHQGDTSDFGTGEVSTYVKMDGAGELASLGVRLSASTFDALPVEPDGTAPCFDVNGDGEQDRETECFMMLRRDLDLPTALAGDVAPFGYVQFNYNPHGHPPPAPPVYAEPHFDFHFYLVGLEDVRKIRTGTCGFFIDCEAFERARVPVPEVYMPPAYIEVGAAAGEEGNHLLLSTAPELGDPPAQFTQTFIFGSYDGHIIFYEPMVSAALFTPDLDECHDIATPAAWEIAGAYPTRYCLRYVSGDNAYEVSLGRFVQRDAS